LAVAFEVNAAAFLIRSNDQEAAAFVICMMHCDDKKWCVAANADQSVENVVKTLVNHFFN